MNVLLLAEADDPAAGGLAERLRDAGHGVRLAAATGPAELAARSGRLDAAIFDGLGSWSVGELRRRLSGVPPAAWLGERSERLAAELLAAGVDEVLHRGMGAQEQLVRNRRAGEAGAATVSTTHTVSSAVLGADATSCFSAVRWGIAGNIVVAWLLTLPAAAAVRAGMEVATRLPGGVAWALLLALGIAGLLVLVRRPRPRPGTAAVAAQS